MDFKTLFTTFALVFLAELGDKTQLATFALAAENKSRWTVFLGSAGALIMTSLMAVLFGSLISRLIPPAYIKMGAGTLFLVLGLWMVVFSGGK